MASSLKTLAVRYPCQAAAAATATGRSASFVPKATFSTATARPICLARASPLRQPSIAASIPQMFQFSRAIATEASKTSPAQPAPGTALDWNTFFKLRVKRRRIQLAFSVLSGAVGGGAGAVLLSTGVAEPILGQIPLDPFFTLGLMTFACVGMGWLVGPSIGSQVFYALNRRHKKQMTQKEAQFFARIKKHRVDPSNSSAGNPVPDFYGEKIQSVSGYRQWLKDQKAFNKKKTANFV